MEYEKFLDQPQARVFCAKVHAPSLYQPADQRGAAFKGAHDDIAGFVHFLSHEDIKWKNF